MPTEATLLNIGDYHIESELGCGAHGVVYRAYHRDRPDTPVALKVLQDRGTLDRLLLEPALLFRLDHPCIVRIEDYFLRGQDVVLALEFIEGEDLKTLIDRGEAFTPEQVRDLLLQIGSALAEAHARNVVHRDIRPSNILVSHAGGMTRYVLTDFSIGQMSQSIQLQKQKGNTCFFMAPEQLHGRPGPQSDLWALGVIAYRLLTGRMPFPGPTLPELTRQICHPNLPSVSAERTEPLDPDLEKAVSRLLQKSPQERIGSAEELLRLLGHRGPATHVVGRTRASRGPARSRDALDRQLDYRIRVRRVLLVLGVLFYLLPGGVLSATLFLAGLALFYRAQASERWSRGVAGLATFAAVLLLAASPVMGHFLQRYDLNLANPLLAAGRAPRPFSPGQGSDPELLFGTLLGVCLVVLYVLYLVMPIILGVLYASMCRLQREQSLRSAACDAGTTSDRYLELLRESLDTRFEDVGFHLRYAEALYARNRVNEAAVEAKLLLKQDPYHFNGTLLLANAYHELGLYEDCIAVCDGYLAVSGACFEFSELRQQCQRRLQSTPLAPASGERGRG